MLKLLVFVEVVLHLVQLTLSLFLRMVIMAVIVFVFVVLTGLLFVLGLLVLMVVVEDSLEEALLLVDRFLGGWFCECFVSARAATDFPVRMS